MVRNSRFILSNDLFKKIFFDLFTPAERIMMAKRVAIIYLLMKKIEYYNICDRLKVSSATVSKIALLVEKSEGIVPAFKQMVKIDKVKIFLGEVFDNIFAPGKVGVNWKIAWENKNKLENKKTFGI